MKEVLKETALVLVGTAILVIGVITLIVNGLTVDNHTVCEVGLLLGMLGSSIALVGTIPMLVKCAPRKQRT